MMEAHLGRVFQLNPEITVINSHSNPKPATGRCLYHRSLSSRVRASSCLLFAGVCSQCTSPMSQSTIMVPMCFIWTNWASWDLSMGWKLLQIVCGSQNGRAMACWRGGAWQEFVSCQIWRETDQDLPGPQKQTEWAWFSSDFLDLIPTLQEFWGPYNVPRLCLTFQSPLYLIL